MAKLPSRDEVVSKHKEAIELALCKRDYDLLASHHGDLLGHIEAAIIDGLKSEQIRRWVMGMVEEETIIQRCTNAARWFDETML